MCGIAGVVTYAGDAEKACHLEEMTRLVAHRGPDGSGHKYFTIGPNGGRCVAGPDEGEGLFRVSLGHRRLAILDLSEAGSQPMADPDGRTWIVHNGEIYNYVELREELRAFGHCFRTATDTEVLLAAYASWGQDMTTRLNGMWAFAILDLDRRLLFCSRDPFGIKPFYYRLERDRFRFGSEIKQLLRPPGFHRDLDAQMVFDYLAFGHLDHTDRTMCAGVFQIPPAHNLVVDLDLNWPPDRRVRVKRYWSLDLDRMVDPVDERLYVEEFRDLLDDAVRIRLRADVAVGSCLSGGLDSSAIVCSMARQLGPTSSSQHAFSACYADGRYDERTHSQHVIAATGAKAHYVFPDPKELLDILDRLIWHQDGPFISTSVFAQHCVFRAAREAGVTVMLDGQGADELLAGYDFCFGPYLAQLFSEGRWSRLWREMSGLRTQHGFSLGRSLDRLVRQHGHDVLYRHGWMRDAKPQWVRHEWVSDHRVATIQVRRAPGPRGLRSRLFELLSSTNLPGLLHYADRSSMANSVEARLPFLDPRLVEFCFRLPDHLKIADGVTKVILRLAMRGIVPDSIVNRQDKMGFVTPEETWLGEHLQREVCETLKRCKSAVSDVVNLPLIQEHLSRPGRGRGILPAELWRIFCFARWLEGNA